VAHDLIANEYRTFKGKVVILCAGTVESAKLALMSQIQDPSGKIGAGITDHPIFFTHFAIPPGTAHYDTTGCSKILSQHKQASANQHPYNMVLELGADFNQGRFIHDDILIRHQQEKGNTMLCELVFLFNAPLVKSNQLAQNGPAFAKPQVSMQPSPAANSFWGEINALKDQLIGQLGGVALFGEDLSLKLAVLGGVAHEVGTLRLGENNEGVVDTNLKFLAYDNLYACNLYACNLSVFPASPAANPTLTLAALAIRLADHLRTLI
jgi:choline dehydrogenase-like flavoprotein